MDSNRILAMSDYSFDRFHLTSAPMRLNRDGKTLNLRAQGLRLLLLLVERRDRVVSHAEIREAIWGERNVDSAKAMPLLIRSIRDALGESANEPVLIETIPRVGYRFVGKLRNTEKSLYLSLAAIAATVLFMISCAVWFQNHDFPDTVSLADVQFKKGDYLLRTGESGSASKARDYFLAALQEDSQHSEALASLAEMSIQRSEFEVAAEYANAAIAIDNSARGHLARAMIATLQDWDWATGALHVEKALRRDPELAEAWITTAMLATVQGLGDDALKASNRAYAIAPVDALIRIDHGWFHYYARDFKSAYRLCSEAYNLSPASWPAAYCRLKSAASGEDSQTTLDAARIVYKMWTDSTEDAAAQAITSLEDFKRWHRSAVQTFLESGEPVWESAAAVEMEMGNNESAIALLVQAGAQHSQNLPLALRDPVFDPLHDDERFLSLMKATGMKL